MSCMARIAAEQRAQLNNVISYHQTSDVAGYVAATMTITNRATYLTIASDALAHTYARNEMLVRVARQTRLNIHTGPHRCLPRADFRDKTPAHDAKGIPRPLSMAQTQTKIVDMSGEIVKVRDCNKALTRLIEDNIAGNDTVDEQALLALINDQRETMSLSEARSSYSSGSMSEAGQPSRAGNVTERKTCCKIQ